MKFINLFMTIFLLIATIFSFIGMFVVDPGFGMSGWTFLLFPCFLFCAAMTFYFWMLWRGEK